MITFFFLFFFTFSTQSRPTGLDFESSDLSSTLGDVVEKLLLTHVSCDDWTFREVS